MKKIYALLMSMILLLGLTACSAPADSTDTGAASQSTSQIQQEDTGEGTSEDIGAEIPDKIEAEISDPAQSDAAPSDPALRHVLVLYFSATGNTKSVAEKIAALTDADLCEIMPAQPYTDDDLNYNDSGSRATKEQNTPDARPELATDPISLEGYDTIYFGYPIWWGEEPRILDTFVEQYEFAELTIIPFCTSASSGVGNSAKHLADLAGGGNWMEGQRFSSNVSEEELSAWIESIK